MDMIPAIGSYVTIDGESKWQVVAHFPYGTNPEVECVPAGAKWHGPRERFQLRDLIYWQGD